MTIEEIRKNFMDEDGYVSCEGCPLKHFEQDKCEEFGSKIEGGEDCVTAIYNYINKDEVDVKNTETVFNVDIVNHPPHYNREGAMESIDEMVMVFGKEVVKHFCLCNVWKYRYRAADKNGAEDVKKSDWYMRKYKELDNLG